MKKELSVRRIFIDSLSFIGDNLPLLGFWTVLSFIGSYTFASFSQRNMLFQLCYGGYVYAFYFLFTGLYLSKKPIITAERFVNSFVKVLTLAVLTYSIWIVCRSGLAVANFLFRHLYILSDYYPVFSEMTQRLSAMPGYSIAIYLLHRLLVAFTFFIPGLAAMAAVDDQDDSIMEAYARVRGNFFKTAFIFVILYGVFPLIINIIGLKFYTWFLAVIFSIQTVFQVVVYLHVYDFFYRSKE